MYTEEKSYQESGFTKEEVDRQVERIFSDPVFARSDILRRFLSYVVEETMNGHESWLKEYTIGTNVLHKSPNFKPADDGIVRIHASRLRRALKHYYNGGGLLDTLRISIPKGGYVPVFLDSSRKVTELPDKQVHGNKTGDVVTVIPFSHIQTDPFENSLASGLALQVSTELMHIPYLSVVAFYITRNLLDGLNDIRQVTKIVKATYIITGEIQTVQNRVRLHMQMIHTPTNKQLWSQMYDRDLATENIFEIQDDIVKTAIQELNQVWRSIQVEMKNSLLAIA